MSTAEFHIDLPDEVVLHRRIWRRKVGIFCFSIFWLPSMSEHSVLAQHLVDNPVFRELRNEGIKTRDGQSHVLPEPMLADGLTAEEQTTVIEAALAGKPLENYVRKSVMAPHVCLLTDRAKTKDYAIRQVDYWFIAYSDWQNISADDFSATTDATDDTTTTEITNAELTTRSIPLPATPTDQILREGFGHVRYRLLNKVEVAATGRAIVTRQPESILAAGLVDPRFSGDDKYPNEWRPLTRNDVGKLEVGTPQPYDGGAGYVKATRLKSYDEAIFVEGHLFLIEPYAWFRGRNQLRGKLPAIIQSQIRDVRRALLKASQKSKLKAFQEAK